MPSLEKNIKEWEERHCVYVIEFTPENGFKERDHILSVRVEWIETKIQKKIQAWYDSGLGSSEK